MVNLTERSFKTYENKKIMYFETDSGWFYITKDNFNKFLKGEDKDLYVYAPKDRWDIRDKIITEMLEKGIFKKTYVGYEKLSVIVSYLDKIGERTREEGCYTTYNDCLFLYKIFNGFNFKHKNITISFQVSDCEVDDNEVNINSKDIDILDFLLSIKYFLNHDYKLKFGKEEDIIIITIADYSNLGDNFILCDDTILKFI